MTQDVLKTVCLCLLLGACGTEPTKPSAGHIRADAPRPGAIPKPVKQAPSLPPPKPAAKPDTYSVVVTNVPAQEILFALARDARLNLDIHPGIQGVVTLNAIDQTLPQILERIARQVDIRHEINGPNLVVMPDTPFLRNYRIDYVNMSRDTTSNVAIATQIATPGAAGATGIPNLSGGGNASITAITNIAKNRFWETLEKNVRDLLRETDKILPAGAATEATGHGSGAPDNSRGMPGDYRDELDRLLATQPGGPYEADPGMARRLPPRTGSSPTFREAAAVIANAETGIIMVRATMRQHEKVQEFLDRAVASARRQVLIEATIVEVMLNRNYQQGIDWQYLQNGGTGHAAIGQGAVTQKFDPVTGALTTVSSTLPSGVANTLFTAAFRDGGFSAAIRLLETFGTIKVVSSPKLSVLNNQTAVLKVVDNLVYFTIRANTSQTQTTSLTTFTTTPNTVSVGFVMSVTPQIGDDDSVLLNVRPTISRTIGPGKPDPNPEIAKLGVISLIPEIQTREMESILRVNNGEIAVMGGLMQDEINNRNDDVPLLANLPLFGNLFSHRNDTTRKTELVIFVRPVVIKQASLDGDYGNLRGALPDQDFLSVRPRGTTAAGADANQGESP